MTPRTRTEPEPILLRRPQRTVGILLGVAVLAVVLVAPALGARTFVRGVTVDNSTAFDVNVEVASDDRRGWLPLGTVGRDASRVFEEVADPGPTWVFRFSYGGVDGGTREWSRSDLRDAGWNLTVPDTVGQELADAGLIPSAR
jgi:hypothetical protein